MRMRVAPASSEFSSSSFSYRRRAFHDFASGDLLATFSESTWILPMMSGVEPASVADERAEEAKHEQSRRD